MRARDLRLPAVMLSLVLIGVAGWVIQRLPASGVEVSTGASEPSVEAGPDVPGGEAQRSRDHTVDQLFQKAAAMLHLKRYDEAVTALHKLLQIEPRLPEAHINMGYALIGLGKHRVALGFFATAIELRPQQANAYYGLAVASEGVGDLEFARGAMRTFLHLADAGDQYVRKARAALWEWQAAQGDAAGRVTGAEADAERRPESVAAPDTAAADEIRGEQVSAEQ